MDISVNEIVTGRKCFFILPDPSLMPVSFLQEFFSMGFECYYIGNDGRIPVQKKIETILGLFKDTLIFINIDYELPDLQWDAYLNQLKNKNINLDQFGIIFLKRQSTVDIEAIQKQYISDFGLKCGFIQLEYQKKFNLELIARALHNNQAQGRRKAIRALCSSACTYKFNYGEKNQTFSGSLQDISLSHFSILCQDEPLPIKLYEKILDIHFNIRGSFFHSDAILVMERQINEKVLYVFAFVTSKGTNGLDERSKQALVPVLHEMISSVCIDLLEKTYRVEEQKKAEAAAQAEAAREEVFIKRKDPEIDPEIAALCEESEKEKE